MEITIDYKLQQILLNFTKYFQRVKNAVKINMNGGWYLLSAVNFAPVILIFNSILPLLSVWSHPHKFGTLDMHFLCTFI